MSSLKYPKEIPFVLEFTGEKLTGGIYRGEGEEFPCTQQIICSN